MLSEILDCCGLACPEPVVRCRALLNDKQPEAIRVLVDNQAASENVSRFLSRNGYQATVTKKDASCWSIAGTRTSENPVSAADEPQQETSKTLVFITTETLGSGNDELGEKLMGNFLLTLPELGEGLWRIVLVNGGVKLAATSGKALESLKAMEQSGVDILVCGTCLSFYGLLEAKEVGDTTNMLDIVTSLALADKVIRP